VRERDSFFKGREKERSVEGDGVFWGAAMASCLAVGGPAIERKRR
jgi:hypothetical protein